jgi:hypothetical protein
MKLFLFAVLAWMQFLATSGGTVRILEGVDKKSDKDDNKLEYVEPDPMYGPSSLSFLQGACFLGSFDRYDYSVCPFQNVTQKRTTAMKPTLIGIWGNWKTTSSPVHAQKGQQKVKEGRGRNRNSAAVAAASSTPSAAADATPSTETSATVTPAAETGPAYVYYNVMEFVGGRNCADGDGSTTVYLQCEHSKFEIVSMDSEVTCEYALTLGLPIACSLLREEAMQAQS